MTRRPVRRSLVLSVGSSLGDVASDASSVRAQAATVEVPEPFRFLLAAQRLERITEEALPEEALFVSRVRRQNRAVDLEVVPMTPLAIHRLLKTVVRETGLLVTTSFSAAQLNEQSLHWSRRRGWHGGWPHERATSRRGTHP